MNMNPVGVGGGSFFADKTKKKNGPDFLNNKTEELKKSLKADEIKSSGANAASKANEAKLSSRAQEYLNSLREQFGDYDFMVGNADDDLRSMVNSSNKEFSVIFSSEEIEKMAADEDYAQEKLRTIDNAVEMSLRINEQFGFESALDAAQGDGNTLSKFGVAIGDDGKVTLFAELEKASEKQNERTPNPNPYANSEDNTVKKMILQAGSEEELMEKLSTIEWKDVPAQEIKPGERLNFTV